MAREDVNIKVSANVAEAIQLWKAMEAGPEGMAKAIDSMGKRGKASTKDMGTEILAMAGKWVTVGAAIAAVTKELAEQYEWTMKLRDLKTETTNSVDEAWNRFQVQAGIKNGPQADLVRNQLFDIAIKRSFDPERAISAFEQLGGAGASVQDIVGGGGDEFLQLLTASNAAGKNVDPGEAARALVLYLEANGLKPNREGMRPTSLAIQQLFGGTNLQLSNLLRFAPEAGKIKDIVPGMTTPEQLAVFSQMLGTMDESRASVAFRGGVVRLSTLGGRADDVRALKSIGLKPEDVDFVGEDFQTVTDRLRKAFRGAPKEKANIAASKIFGEEGLGFYNVLLTPEGAAATTKQRIAMATSTEGAAERLAIAESGRSAAMRQAEAIKAKGLYDNKALDPDVLRKRLEGLVVMFGLSERQQATILGSYDDPWGPNWLRDMTPEGRAYRAADRIAQIKRFSSNDVWGVMGLITGRNELRQQFKKHGASEEVIRAAEQRIRLIAPDGLDIPHEPAAGELSQ